MRLICLFFVSIVVFSFSVSAKTDLSTPRRTIENHYNYTSHDHFNLEKAAKSLNLKDFSSQSGPDLAFKLRQIFDSKGLEVDFDKIPDKPDFFDSVTGRYKYILFVKYPDIYVEKINGRWLFSDKTVSNINKYYKEIFRFGTDRLLLLMPRTGHHKILGVQTWQLYGILILLISACIIYLLLKWINESIIFRIVKRFISAESAKNLIKPVAKPLNLFIIISILSLFVPILQFDVKTNKVILSGLKIMASVFGMLVFYKLVDVLGAYLDKIAKKTSSSLDDQLVPIVNKMLKVIVVIIGILFILNFLNFNITALLAGISIGGLALALAAQDAIKNLFGSLMIFLDKPFQIGDWIVTDGVDGMVEEVGFRSTRIRTVENSLITVPNGKLADLTIDNLGLRVYRRFFTRLNMPFSTPIYQSDAFIQGIKEIIKLHPHSKKDGFEVSINEIGDFSVKLFVMVYFTASTLSEDLKFRHELIQAILRLAEELGVKFAYPTETLSIEQMPGQKLSSNAPKLSKDEYNKRINSFISNLRNTKPFQYKQVEKPREQEHPKPEIKKPQSHETKNLIVNQTHELAEEKFNDQKKSIKTGKSLTEDEISDTAKMLKISTQILKALIKVESNGKGHLQDGKPVIRFQGHRFWNELNKAGINPEELQEKYPEIIYQRATRRFFKSDDKEYERLEKAKSIHKEAAYKSTNWGMFQVPGSEFKMCNFNTVNEFVFNHYQTEKEQLEAFARYLKTKNLVKDLSEQKWEDFAKRYKGPAYKKLNYVEKLLAAINKE